ncbi:PREDICTED: WD repeat-containing protein 18 [Polistes dominula]|uniref:WD repeat-containing protein 18 n=1 Tax=Polistes dominula TaxID=743375 RepID=A0ABM1IZ37_POLDO|nr:PREDICTED: WD repeat-containing protein 18 [Polistes dominula]
MELIITSDNVAESWSAAVWDPNTGTLVSIYKHAAPIANKTLQVLSDCYLIGADAAKPLIHVWPLNSQRPISNIRLITPGKVSALTSTSDGSYIVAAINEKLYVWQICNGRLLAIITRHYQTVTCLKFTRDNSMFVSAGEDGLILVWSLFNVINNEEQRSQPIYTFSNHTLPVKDIYIGHCAPRARLCSVSLDHTANVFELKSGRLLATFVFDLPLTSVCMNIKESELFVGTTSGLIYKFNLHEPPRGIEHHVKILMNENAEDSTIYRGHESTIVSLSVSTDCRHLLSACLNGKVHLWNVDNREIVKTFSHKGQITSAFYSKHFNNFHVKDLKPSLHIHPLQRVSEVDNSKEHIINITRKGRDTSDFVNLQSFVEEESSPCCSSSSSCSSKVDSDVISKLENLKEENQRLKKINAELFKHSVEFAVEHNLFSTSQEHQ